MEHMEDDQGERGAAAGGAETADDNADLAAPRRCFTQLQDSPLSAELALCVWSPAMDLCAVAAADGQLRVHRMSWQALWAAAPAASRVTALAWAPDGKALAAGHADGSVTLYDVESGAPRARRRGHFAAIVQLAWFSGAAEGEEEEGCEVGGAATAAKGGKHIFVGGEFALPPMPLRHTQLFAPPDDSGPGSSGGGSGGGGGGHTSASSAAAGTGGSSGAGALPEVYASMTRQAAAAFESGGGGGGGGGGGEAAGSSGGGGAWPPEPRSLDLLFAADARGRVSAWAHGEVQLLDAAAPAADGAGGGPGRVLAMTAAPRLDEVFFVQQHDACGLALRGAGLRALRRRRADARRCALLFGLVQAQLAAASRALGAAAREWRGAAADVRRRMEQLESDQADAGAPAPSARGDIALLLLTGAATQGLQQFLLSTLGEAGLRRLARAVDGAAAAVAGAVRNTVLPRVALATFVLGELRGHVAASRRLQELGLEPHAIEALEACGARAMLRAERLRLAALAAARRHRCLFAWLLRILRALDGGGGGDAAQQQQEQQQQGNVAPTREELRDIRELLRGELVADVIGPELQTSPLDEDEQQRADAALKGAITAQAAEALLRLFFPCRPGPPAGLAALLSKAGGESGAEGLPSEAADAARALPLAGLLQHLSEQCEATFERPQQAISAAMAPTLHLRLAPAAALAAAAGAESSAAAAAAAPVLVAAGAPMRPPAATDEADRHACFVCCLPGGGGSRGGSGSGSSGSPLLLVTRLEQAAAAATKKGGSSGSKASVTARACVLSAPPGCRVIDAAPYKGGRLAVLTQASHGHARPAVLSLLDLDAARWVELSLGPDAPTALEQCVGAAVPLSALPGRRARALAGGAVAPLAVGRERGLACVASDVLRAAVLDLEEDEEEEDEDEDVDDDAGDGMEEE